MSCRAYTIFPLLFDETVKPDVSRVFLDKILINSPKHLFKMLLMTAQLQKYSVCYETKLDKPYITYIL